MTPFSTTRRGALLAFGRGAAALTVTGALASAARAEPAPALPKDGALADLTRTLASLPRRRGFQTVPFMLTDRAFWDHEAADALLAYGAERQMWEATDLAGGWVGLMRESLNCQVFVYGHRDFLSVSATHGPAHFALFSQGMWDKYGLAAKTGGKFASNTLVAERADVSPADDLQDVGGFYGPENSTIPALQQRGMVFVACHDSIHSIARGIAATPEFADTSAAAIAADLTNNVVTGAVLVPSVVAFIAELQRAGYSYAKG